MRLFAFLGVLAAFLAFGATASGSVGSSGVGSDVDSNVAGRSQDYRFTASATEQVDRLNVYLDRSNTATTVELGLYASSSSSSAGSRLGRCVVGSAVADAWNRCTISPVKVTSGASYWLAILQPRGTSGAIKYRNRTGTGRTFGSSSASLTQVPATWSNGSDWGAQAASVFADQAPSSTPAPPPPPPSPDPAPADNTPQHVSAKVSGNDVVLDWDDTKDPDFHHYAVRRSTDPNADQATWTRLAPSYTVSTARDSDLDPDTYYYYVTEASQNGDVSGRSAVVSATVAGSTPAPPPPPDPGPTPPPPPDPGPTPPPPPSGGCTAMANTAGGADLWGGCFPGPSNTGVPAGTTLTAYTGSCTVTAANAVIDRKTVNCSPLNIAASGVKITNSKINGSVWIDDQTKPYSFTISDSEIDAGTTSSSINDGVSAIGKSNFVATRVETHGGIRGVWCEYNCTLQDSYIHGQARDSGGHAHESGVRMGSGNAQVIRHNTLLCDAPDVPPDAGCSADLTGYGDFAPIRNNTIDRNLFLATTGGTCAYGGASGKDGSKPYGNQSSNIVFTDNVFQRRSGVQSSGKCGVWFAIADFDSSRPGNKWSNNRWDDGSTVPPG